MDTGVDLTLGQATILSLSSREGQKHTSLQHDGITLPTQKSVSVNRPPETYYILLDRYRIQV
jgi:hypothetical protein